MWVTLSNNHQSMASSKGTLPIDPPGKKQPFLFFSKLYCVEMEYFHFNVIGLGINTLQSI